MIKSFKSLLVLSALAILFSGPFASAAIAQNSEGASLRLEEPLDFGGTVLEPGVYLITVVPGDHRNVLKVTGEDGTKTFATVLAVPHATPATVEQKGTQFVYFPTTAGSTRVLRTWFAPDSATGDGYDIVYPELRAKKLATVANGPVVAYKDGTSAADLNTAELESVTPDQEVTAYPSPDAVAPDAVAPDAVAPDAVASDAVAPDEEEESAEVTQAGDLPVTDDSELPSTASPMPLLGALGLLLLLAAGGVRILRTAQP